MALFALLLASAGLMSLHASAAPFGSGRLPKGFPYAAEIRATIEYDGTYQRNSVTDIPCNNGENETTLNGSEADTLHFKRTIIFSHITVPIAKPRELGASTAKLALSPTITSSGKLRSDRSTMDFKGALAIGDAVGEGCHTTNVTCHWEVQGAPAGVSQQLVSRTNGFLPEAWYINALGTNAFIEEECPVATGGEELDTQLHQAATLYLQTDDEPGFPEVAIDPKKLGDFHQLLHRQNLSFTQHIDGGSNTNCAGEEGTKTCSQSVSGSAKITLHRIAFYRTKHVYLR
ncbi:MAG: hypothetical protein JWM24_1015 [Solirubrobacterales bacterium]|nr:hypothetical protein [Solirubrobacterales bacterium]